MRGDVSKVRDMLVVMGRRWANDGGGGGEDMTMAPARQGQGDNCARPDQARQRRCNDGITIEVTRERENA
jgi:hypothetical protein